ncbi:MAG: hypothetical protein ACLQUY_14150 [Ktedonobacterales bacterium]
MRLSDSNQGAQDEQGSMLEREPGREDGSSATPPTASGGAFLRLLRQIGPLLAVAVVLVCMAGIYYFRWDFEDKVWDNQKQPSAVPIFLAFNDVGRKWSTLIGDQGQSVAPLGYDGQFYFFMAQNPAIITACADGSVHCPLDAQPLREERILYPMTARLLALGNSNLLHPVLFLIDFAAILITVWLIGALCVASGVSRWLSVAAGLFAGEVLALLRDVSDPYAVMWTVVAVYLMRRGRPLWSALAVAAALLTREQLVLVLPLLCLPLLAERRWRTAFTFLVIALAPFSVWQFILYRLFGRFGLTESAAATHGLELPFRGLLQNYGSTNFAATVIFVAIPLVVAFGLALVWIRQHGVRALLSDPVPLIVLVYAFVATLTAYNEWADPWAAGRLVAPAIVLGVLVACGLSPRLRGGYALLLCATLLVLFFVPATLP